MQEGLLDTLSPPSLTIAAAAQYPETTATAASPRPMSSPKDEKVNRFGEFVNGQIVDVDLEA